MITEDSIISEISEISITDLNSMFVLLLILGFLFIFIIGIYLYSSFAYSAIAKKAKHKNPGLAWIPVIGPTLISLQIAKMHWWPLLLTFFIWIPFVGIIFETILLAFTTIWDWKTFEAVKKPGWWAVFSAGTSFISIVFAALLLEEEIPLAVDLISLTGSLIFLALIGVAAWSKKK